MKRKLLSFLVCPECGASVDLGDVRSESGPEILEATLVCASGAHSFPVVRGIPRLLVGFQDKLRVQTQKNFAFSWRKFGEIYSDPRDFLDWLAPKTRDFFADKTVLDAGCGAGQHAAYAAAFGAKDVVAFDLSPAVEVAFEHARRFPNVHVVQADMYRLPFKDDFDFVYCIGVLQHIPDTPKGFARLARLIRKNGWISVWVYGYEGNAFVRRVIDPIRKVASRMPLPAVYALSAVPASVFYLLAKLIYRPLNAFPETRRLAAALPMNSYLDYMARFNPYYVFNSVFDQLIAPITQYFRREQVREWFREADLTDIALTQRNGMSWRATGRRP